MDCVSQALIQLCRRAKVAEIYTTVPEECFDFVKNDLKATPLNEASPAQWLISGIKGEMDLVFDSSCEDGLESSCQALKQSGKLVCFGHSSMLKEETMGLFGAPISPHFNKFWSQTKSR